MSVFFILTRLTLCIVKLTIKKDKIIDFGLCIVKNKPPIVYLLSWLIYLQIKVYKIPNDS